MSIPKVSIRQIKAARALIGWSQATLAEKCGVSLPTIKRLESADIGEGIGGRPETIVAIKAALSAAGVTFLDDGESVIGGIGVRLR
ncbi:helix-turn-helix domain-containing protein [Devosia sp. CAU 1758]